MNLYHSVNSFGETVQVFQDRNTALEAYFAGSVKNVYNTYQPGYHRHITARQCDKVGTEWVSRKPTFDECVGMDV